MGSPSRLLLVVVLLGLVANGFAQDEEELLANPQIRGYDSNMILIKAFRNAELVKGHNQEYFHSNLNSKTIQVAEVDKMLSYLRWGIQTAKS